MPDIIYLLDDGYVRRPETSGADWISSRKYFIEVFQLWPSAYNIRISSTSLDAINCAHETRPWSVIDLARAVITVGKSSWAEVFSDGIARQYEIIARLCEVIAYTEVQSGHLHVSDLYRALDASEKQNASYRFGMGFAKLAAEDGLNVPWLRHLDKMDELAVGYSSTSKDRPDLLGLR